MSSSSTSSATTTTNELSKKYQQKTEIQHILDRPNVCIGSVHLTSEEMWVVDVAAITETVVATSEQHPKIVSRLTTYVPALYKLFDEGIVNCRDHIVRMRASEAANKKLVTFIDVKVDAATGTIEMMNDGDGLDVARHPETGIWIPEMVFGHLRTSTNYDKDNSIMVGGQNGLGFKLVLIWSTYGCIETLDHRRGLLYRQEFLNNLGEIRAPVISKVTGGGSAKKPYTRIVFRPDYARLGQEMTPDMMSLFHKRVMDIGALSDDKVRVSFNGAPTVIKNFQKYIELFPVEKKEKVLYERPVSAASAQWEFAVTLSPTHSFQQVSYVNGICTYKGGKHVDYVVGKITREVAKYIETKKKVKVSPATIRDQLFVFVKCEMLNPTFDSQTKECLNTPIGGGSAAGTDGFALADTFAEKVAKLGVMDLVCSITKARDDSKVARTTDGKRGRALHIEKYTPANWAGTAKSKDCILILCEGDSAKSGILSGLSKEDRDIIGIYPLKGKLLNVRGEDAATIGKNKEITELKQIMGLENGREYKTQEDVNRHLNYSRVMILCDADVDGSHIKGLCINLFHCEWSSLLQIPGFLCYMNTPILRATKGQTVRAETLLFYNEGEFAQWKSDKTPQQLAAWTIKYYKGLGTSTAKEFKEYFANKKHVSFEMGSECAGQIDMAFNKKLADIRKRWLESYDRRVFLDTRLSKISYGEFIQKELIKFCCYSCERAIPNVMDGMKTSQRKILYSAFKRNLTTEIKVAQFAGYVSEHSNYHHGEASLCGTIIHMAQNYVGSNNINLLAPNGQFGTRIGKDGSPGDDHASPRYIFTELASMTRALFPKDDDAILTYLEDDGDSIEPEFYLPIIPMILVNGAEGIGMGYSTQVVCYSPENIIDYLEARLGTTAQRLDTSEWVPYYEGFRGTITRMEGGGAKFLVRGIVEEIGADKVRITELPIGMATSKMMSLLKTLVEPVKDSKTDKVTGPAVIKDYCENNTDTQVDIVVEFPKGGLAAHRANLDKLLKLTTTLTTANMYLFDSQCRLRKYERVDDILEEYYNVRLAAFERRRAHVIAMKERDLVLLSNRARYILETLEGQIDLRRKSGAEIVALLSGREFAQIEGDYEYLLKLRMDSVSKEKAAKIIEERDHVAAQLAGLRATTGAQIWLGELRALRALRSDAAYRGARGGEAVAEKKKTTSTLKKRATTSNTK